MSKASETPRRASELSITARRAKAARASSLYSGISRAVRWVGSAGCGAKARSSCSRPVSSTQKPMAALENQQPMAVISTPKMTREATSRASKPLRANSATGAIRARAVTIAVRTASARRRPPTFTGEVAGVGTSGVASQLLRD